MTLQKSSLVFNLEYPSKFFIKFKDRGQLAMRISKLTLIFEFYAELTEIFKVEYKAQFTKSQ